MNSGVFCFFETDDSAWDKSLREENELVLHAEELGFEEAWAPEHHFNPSAPSSSLLSLLSYWAAITRTIRIGSAAVLAPFYHPIRLAEDLSTIDQLSRGRLNFGVARGGPFPLQNQHFQVPKERSSQLLLESLEIVQELLYRDEVTFRGKWFEGEGVTISPKPFQAAVPVFLATQTETTIRYAAERSYGVMGAQPWPVEKLENLSALYRAVNPSATTFLTLLRSFYVAQTRRQALEEALPLIRSFLAKTRRFSPPFPFTETDLLRNGLIGDVLEVREKIAELSERLPLRSLVLRPLSRDQGKRLKSLEIYKERTEPHIRS